MTFVWRFLGCVGLLIRESLTTSLAGEVFSAEGLPVLKFCYAVKFNASEDVPIDLAILGELAVVFPSLVVCSS